MRFHVVDALRCPKCGAPESHPNGKHVLIRAFKVDMNDGHGWYSQCLVCSGYYRALRSRVNGVDSVEYVETKERHNGHNGWVEPGSPRARW